MIEDQIFFKKKARYVIWPNSIVTSDFKSISVDHAAKWCDVLKLTSMMGKKNSSIIATMDKFLNCKENINNYLF